jgi:hypothetical protein
MESECSGTGGVGGWDGYGVVGIEGGCGYVGRLNCRRVRSDEFVVRRLWDI